MWNKQFFAYVNYARKQFKTNTSEPQCFISFTINVHYVFHVVLFLMFFMLFYFWCFFRLFYFWCFFRLFYFWCFSCCSIFDVFQVVLFLMFFRLFYFWCFSGSSIFYVFQVVLFFMFFRTDQRRTLNVFFLNLMYLRRCE